MDWKRQAGLLLWLLSVRCGRWLHWWSMALLPTSIDVIQASSLCRRFVTFWVRKPTKPSEPWKSSLRVASVVSLRQERRRYHVVGGANNGAVVALRFFFCPSLPSQYKFSGCVDQNDNSLLRTRGARCPNLCE